MRTNTNFFQLVSKLSHWIFFKNGEFHESCPISSTKVWPCRSGIMNITKLNGIHAEICPHSFNNGQIIIKAIQKESATKVMMTIYFSRAKVVTVIKLQSNLQKFYLKKLLENHKNKRDRARKCISICCKTKNSIIMIFFFSSIG